jgi:hypothetical protein
MSPDELSSRDIGVKSAITDRGKHSAIMKPKPVPITIYIDVKVILR